MENDKCLITICPLDENPTTTNLVKLNCRDTEEILTTDSFVNFKKIFN